MVGEKNKNNYNFENYLMVSEGKEVISLINKNWLTSQNIKCDENKITKINFAFLDFSALLFHPIYNNLLNYVLWNEQLHKRLSINTFCKKKKLVKAMQIILFE